MDGQHKVSRRWGAAAIACLALSGVAVAATHVAADGGTTSGWATLQDGKGETVGFARFTEHAAGGVRVDVHVSGMTQGLHGIHVHDVGSCSTGTGPFSGAGPHYNPAGVLHGAHADPAAVPRQGAHVGDLPNMVVGRVGIGSLHTRLDKFTLTAGPTSILAGDGSALVVHATRDDYMADPAGNSGARIACGIIQPR